MRDLSITLKFFWSVIKKRGQNFLSYTSLSILLNVLKLWIPAFFISILLSLLEKGEFTRGVWLLIIAFGIILIINISNHFITMKITIISAHVNNDLNVAVYKKKMTVNFDDLEKEETRNAHELAKIALNEVGVLKMTNNLKSIMESLLSIVIAIVSLTSINVYIIIVLLVIAMINIISEVYRVKYQYEMDKDTADIELNLYYARDYLASPKFAKEIRSFNMKDFILGKLNGFIDKFAKIKVDTELKYLKRFWIVYIFDGIMLIIIYLSGIYQYYAGGMDIGLFSLYLSAMTTMVYSLLNGVRALTAISGDGKYVGALNEFLNKKSVSHIGDKKIDEINASNVHIEFKNVSFKYPKSDDYILRDLNLIISAGEKISLVGKNGAGKTTMVKLLLGLYKPTKGKILIQGVDYQEYSDDELYKLFSVVLQDFGIYNFTINNNISMNQEIDQEKAKQCMEEMQVWDKVDSLYAKGESYISQRFDENGIDLSGGERQKLAMARALYKDSPIYIFDEPTSALSPQSEYEVYQNFSNISKDKMVIFISHRLASCRLCDKILVLDQGEIVNSGSHDELIKSDNLYSRMFRTQAESFNG